MSDGNGERVHDKSSLLTVCQGRKLLEIGLLGEMCRYDGIFIFVGAPSPGRAALRLVGCPVAPRNLGGRREGLRVVEEPLICVSGVVALC
jgi:hypothetical protein